MKEGGLCLKFPTVAVKAEDTLQETRTREHASTFFSLLLDLQPTYST